MPMWGQCSAPFDKLDGYASIGIAIILGVTATILALQAKSLLIGIAAPASKVGPLLAAAAKSLGVLLINGAETVQLSPDTMALQLSVAFDPGLMTKDVEHYVEELETMLKADHPEFSAVFVEQQSPDRYARIRAARER